MSEGKNALQLPGDYIHFNLKVKIILLPLFDAQKSTYTKNTVPESFDFLVSFVTFNISIQHEIQGNKRTEIIS